MAKPKNSLNLDSMNNINKKLIQDIQNNINTVYNNTYFSDNKNNSYIDSIRRRIDNDINSLMDKNRLRTNGSNISNLYAKTMAKNDSDIIK